MTARPPRVVLAAGGTGGHFYPGYVLGRALREQGFETLYLVREDDPAGKVLAADNLPYVEVPLRGLPRRPGPDLIRFFWKLAKSLRLVGHVIADFKPDALVAMGGYLTFPAAYAAWRRDVPVLLHESNSILGLANKASLPFARRLAIGLPFDRPPRVPFLLSGTPVRRDLWRLPDPAAARAQLGLDPANATILVFGGSQGARAMNKLVPEGLKLAAGALKGSPESSIPGAFQVLHLAGAKEVDAATSAYAGAPFAAKVLPYLHEMERGYAAADLVICRSGASTLAELAATGKPALLVPFPFAAADHQAANAWVAARAGAARSLSERELTPASLAAAVSDLIPSGSAVSAARARLLEMGRRWGRLGLPSAPDCVAGLASTVRELTELR
ncbi:MAG: UDP-N-acetylglucosamine--N-acetylmuramyl-(pentapeptide) pyrophosphoryl-undecaprenol N-acetylglucosamine transferase [Elusimicrobia bacterium]|nr:UDP-N-acetylglucosamine--N-acetylmuramyl-(pentapeptide) pyrophosphoryl-undecaprenol N-acetylglucosamine transferase [Elusimicrobiota bacterium]